MWIPDLKEIRMIISHIWNIFIREIYSVVADGRWAMFDAAQ